MIKIEELHNVFDLWIDKTSSPYFTSDQKDTFIQKAVDHFINNFFKNNVDHVMERSSVDVEDLHTLINVVNVPVESDGRMLMTEVNSKLPIGKEWTYILRVSRMFSDSCGANEVKSRFVRHNDYLAIKDNVFKKPSEKYPVHLYVSDAIQFYPKKGGSSTISVLVNPNEVNLDDVDDSGERGVNAVDLDLPNKVFNEIMYIALTKAGISIREGEFYAASKKESMDNV